MDNPTPPIEFKQCSSKQNCLHPNGPYLPATKEYFYVNSARKDGFHNYCKVCFEGRRPNRSVYRKTYYQRHKIDANRRHHEYWHRNKEFLSAQSRARYQKNKAAIQRQHDEYRKKHPDEASLRTRRWQQENPEKVALQRHRHRGKKRSLPNNFTSNDWQYALNYFHYCCAVCGRQAKDLFDTHTLSLDHWIPLSSPNCPGTVPTNVIPLCYGLNGCNNSKKDRDPLDWLTARYGKRKAHKILKHIEAYFEIVRAIKDT